jgi:uncharacterized protein (TIGR02466 family)
LIHSIFPIPVVHIQREFYLDSIEVKEIAKILKEGMIANYGDGASGNNIDESSNIYSIDNSILSRLHKLKKFIEEHIKLYVKEVISPEEELEFYITQSWLNIIKPGQRHNRHWHSNSILSGVFYIKCVEEDKIYFHDPSIQIKDRIAFSPKEFNLWNSSSWFISIKTNDLLIFPSWLEHSVDKNINATGDRISISFNIFVRGILGSTAATNKLIL